MTSAAEETSTSMTPAPPPLPKLDTAMDQQAPDESKADAPRSSTSSQKNPAPLARTRTMSSGGGLLRRLTSRNSVHTQDSAEYATPPVSSPSKSSIKSAPPKADKAALSRSTSKYKSGARWDLLDFNGMGESPQDELMDTGTAARKREEAARIEAARAAEEQKKTAEMLAQGSTAAAKAYAQRQSIGDPFFAAHQRAAADAAAAQAQRMHQTALATQQYPPIGQTLADGGRPVQSGPSQDRMLAEAAQRVLEAARRTTNANGSTSTPASPVASSTAHSRPPSLPASSTMGMTSASGHTDTARSSLQKGNGSPLRSAPASISSARSKSFLGFSKKDKEEKESSKGKASGKKSQRQGRRAVSDYAGAEKTDVTKGEAGSAAGSAAGSVDTTRRRRYKDTRELDLLASELAASALVGNRYGTQTPYMNGSTDNFSPGAYPFGSASQGNLASPSATFLQPGGASPQMSRMSMTPSSVPNSPQHLAHDGSRNVPPLDPSQVGSQRSASQSTHSLSVPSSPYATQRVQLNGLPPDMLTGLGDGPYPSLARRIENAALAFGLDPVDPFGIPTNHMDGGPFEASMQYANRTNVYHSPTQSSFRGRSGSSGASSITSPSKRPMLSMSMYSPETELEGLTKPPRGKGSRANSRNVTPKTSSSGLREKSRESAGAMSNGAGATSNGSAVNGVGSSAQGSASGNSSQGHNAVENGSGSNAPSPDLTNAPKKSSNLTVPSVNAGDKTGKDKEGGSRMGRLSFFGGGRRSRANSLTPADDAASVAVSPVGSPVGSTRAPSVGAPSSVGHASESVPPFVAALSSQDQLFLTTSHDSAAMAKRSSGLSSRSRERENSGSSLRSQGASPARSATAAAAAAAAATTAGSESSSLGPAMRDAARDRSTTASEQEAPPAQQPEAAPASQSLQAPPPPPVPAESEKKHMVAPLPPSPSRPSRSPVRSASGSDAGQRADQQTRIERSPARPAQPAQPALPPAQDALQTPRPTQRRAVSPARTERPVNHSTSAGAAQNRKVSAQSLASAIERPSSKASSSTGTSESGPNKNRFSRFVSRLTSSDKAPKAAKPSKQPQQVPARSAPAPARSAPTPARSAPAPASLVSSPLSEQQRKAAVARSTQQRQAAMQQASLAHKASNQQLAAQEAPRQSATTPAAASTDEHLERLASAEVPRQKEIVGDRRPSATPSNMSAEDDFRAAQAFVNAGLGGSLRSSISGHAPPPPPSAASNAGFGTRAAIHEIIPAAAEGLKSQATKEQQQTHNQSGGTIPSEYDLTPHTSDGSVSTRSTDASSAGIPAAASGGGGGGGLTPTAHDGNSLQSKQQALHQELGLGLDGQDTREAAAAGRFQLSSSPAVMGQ